MPTAAQRQRAAALAQSGQHQQKTHHANPAGVAATTTSRLHQPQSSTRATDSRPSTSKLTALEADWEDGAFSDDDSDEEASAFEMDGQDAWTQNYCSICDTLIEPGQGLIEKREHRLSSSNQPPQSPPSSTAVRDPLPSSGLKSKSGTIKARPTSSDGGNGSNFKRSNSAGRIHAVGGAGPLAPAKRTGSAGSRLNALSELRPTTRLNGEVGKGKYVSTESGSTGTKSPALSRRSSTVSVRSSHSGAAAAAADGSHPSSPTSPGSALPRTKKGGILGNLTPAALKQQEELEAARIKAPPALYCSERCRQMDQQRSSGMGELVYYLQQPTSPSSAVAWQTGPSSYGAWSSRTSSGNIPALARGAAGAALPVSTPESECMCPDCLDKNSISGTVPSGASDTAESSASYQPYGPRDQKQRTQSGRIVTPLNLHPSGVHWSTGDYFGNAAHATQRARQNTGEQRTRRDSLSQAGTASSTKSSDSGSDLWEPNLHRRRGKGSNAGRAEKGSATYDTASTTSDAADRGTTTTGTVTPEGNRLAGTDSLALMTRFNVERSPARGGESGSSLSSSSANPLRLIRQGDQVRAAASVDVSAELVASSPYASAYGVLSHSMASERTEGAASSGFTTVAPQPSSSLLAASLLERRQIGRPFTLDFDGASPSATGAATDKVTNVNVEHYRFTDSPAPFDKSANGSRAIGTLKKHAQGQSSTRLSGLSQSVRTNGQATSRQSVSSTGGPAATIDERSHDSSSSSWFRSSISAAWNTLRGLPPSDGPLSATNNEADERRRSSVATGDDDRVVDESATRNDDASTGQGLIKRPTIKRGDVPAFAHEIGWGGIPGEREESKVVQPAGQTTSVASSGGKGWEEHSSGGETANALSKSATSRRDSTESERRRRRAERDRAHRHQRSKDVSVLPPLLGVARPASSVNLAPGNASAVRASRAYSTASARSTDMMTTAPDSPLLAPVRSNTPNLRRGSHSASLVGLHEFGTSPGRMGTVGSLGTSPRRAGLGWGALTPLGPPSAVAPVSRGSNVAVHAAHHAHHHHNQHQHHHHHHHHHHGGHHQGHRAHASTIALGNIGMLGAHPHGNAPVVGRHSTTPIRMSTPRVPEDGGEMSAAQLKGEMTDDLQQSRSFGRRSLLHVPQRPKSVLSMRGGHAAPAMVVDPYQLPPQRTQTPLSMHGRQNSSEDARASGMKLYPVLDVPNRPQTHDRYDTNFSVDLLPPSAAAAPAKDAVNPVSAHVPVPRRSSANTSASALRASRPPLAGDAGERRQGSQHSPLSSRKKLFYFDTS